MMSEKAVVEREIFIAAPVETVFQHLTDARLVAHWLGSFQQLDPQPDGMFQVEVSPGHVARGESVEVVPFRRVVFTWDGFARARPGRSAACHVDRRNRA